MANPTDLVKVRLQAEGKLPAGVPRRYSGAVDAYYTIVRQVSFLQVDQCFFFQFFALNFVFISAYSSLFLNICQLFRKE